MGGYGLYRLGLGRRLPLRRVGIRIRTIQISCRISMGGYGLYRLGLGFEWLPLAPTHAPSGDLLRTPPEPDPDYAVGSFQVDMARADVQIRQTANVAQRGAGPYAPDGHHPEEYLGGAGAAYPSTGRGWHGSPQSTWRWPSRCDRRPSSVWRWRGARRSADRAPDTYVYAPPSTAGRRRCLSGYGSNETLSSRSPSASPPQLE